MGPAKLQFGIPYLVERSVYYLVDRPRFGQRGVGRRRVTERRRRRRRRRLRIRLLRRDPLRRRCP